MATPEISDVVTQGIRVAAGAIFAPAESEPDDRRYVFDYNILIANNSDAPVQLLSRRWIIIDAVGRREEVEGPGVVGQTPRIEPGQAFKYQSHCPLKTSWGTMEGSYTMRRDNGETFEVQIGRFYLRVPK